MTGIISFLAGGAGRWLIGELLGWLKARQERKDELERMRLQLEQDRQRHEWQQQAIQAQAAAGVRVIEAKAVADAASAADAAFLAAVESVGQASQRPDKIGAWNAAIRPLLATVGILLLVGNAVAPAHVVLVPVVMDLILAALGIFVGERIRQRGA